MGEERNKPCPCLSGKKYKKCCSNRKEFVQFFRDNFHAQYIDTSYILNDIISNSKVMENYLIENLSKLKKSIIWLYDQNLNANMRSMYMQDFHIIILKNIPINSDDYFDVAHEIGHLILGELGYPSTRIIDSDMRKVYLGTILSNTILDPKINQELIKYGFNFEKYIDKGINIQVPLVDKYPSENNLHKYDKHFLKCLLIEKILEWDLFTYKKENPFIDIYKSKYQTIYNEALDEIAFIRQLGTDTPQK